jgi:hypothetical protein
MTGVSIEGCAVVNPLAFSAGAAVATLVRRSDPTSMRPIDAASALRRRDRRELETSIDDKPR